LLSAPTPLTSTGSASTSLKRAVAGIQHQLSA
jgi:hypothetical protein